MRHYRSAAARDEKRERLAAALRTRALNRMQQPARDAIPQREPGTLLLIVNGQRFDVDLQPNRRNVRRWNVTINGQPWRTAGLEQVWRELQRRLVPMLGARNLG